MEPAFRPGDRLLVDPAAYVGRSPSRGEVVVLSDPADPERWLLKRVVGTAGDFVRITSAGAQRIPARTSAGAPPPPSALEELEVPQGQVFVLADRPSHSRDSRQFGSVSERALLGQVWRRYYPHYRAADLELGEPLSDR